MREIGDRASACRRWVPDEARRKVERDVFHRLDRPQPADNGIRIGKRVEVNRRGKGARMTASLRQRLADNIKSGSVERIDAKARRSRRDGDRINGGRGIQRPAALDLEAR